MTGAQLFYLVFDLALGALALRSAVVLRRRAPLTTIGWIAMLGYALAAGAGAGGVLAHRVSATWSYLGLLALTVAFVAAGIRDEPQAEPWWWPVRVGKTRAERRAYPGN